MAGQSTLRQRVTWGQRTLWILGLVFWSAALYACAGESEGVGASDGGSVEEARGVGETCSIAAECRRNLVCEAEVCQPSGEVPEGSSCALSAECAEGLSCVLCTGEDGSCEASLGSACLPSGGVEEGGACAGNQDCGPGLFCQIRGFTGGVCEPGGGGDIGAACASTRDCMAGLGCTASLVDPSQTICQAGALSLPEVFPGVECTDDDGPFRVFFEVPEDPAQVREFYRLPFPNNIRLVNGHPDMRGHATPGKGLLEEDLIQTYLDVIQNEQDHFGTNQGVFLRFSGALDFDSVVSGGEDNTRNLILVDISPGSETLGARQSLYWQGSTGRNKYICDNWMMVRPIWGRALKPRSTYAVLLLNSVQSEDGTPLVRDADFDAMLSTSAPPEPQLALAWQQYEPLRSWLSSPETDLDPSSVAVATVFTTGDPLTVTESLRPAVRNAAPITHDGWTLCDDGVASPCDDGLEGEEHTRGCFPADNRIHELHTRVSLPIFQEGQAPYETEGGGLVFEGATPTVQTKSPVCTAVTIPKDRDMPEDGWPVLLVAHGTGGSFRGHAGGIGAQVTTLSLNGEDVPMLTVGWDQVQHFTRRGDSTLDPEGLVYNFLNPDAARGNFWQGAADVHAMVAWLESLDVSADDSPTGQAFKINPQQIYFLGHSQGGTTGPIALPFEPSVQGAILSGAGGGLILSLLAKTSPVNIPQAVRLVLQEKAVSEAHPVLNLLQGFFEPVDPVNYAEYIGFREIEGRTTARHVFHTMGVGDTYTPKDTQEVLATALRATLIEPTTDELTRAFVQRSQAPVSANVVIDGEPKTVITRQYAPNAGDDGHFVLFRNDSARNDLEEFLSSSITLGIPAIQD